MCVASGGEGKGGKRVDRSMTWAHNHLPLSSENAVEYYRRQCKDEPFGSLDTRPL